MEDVRGEEDRQVMLLQWAANIASGSLPPPKSCHKSHVIIPNTSVISSSTFKYRHEQDDIGGGLQRIFKYELPRTWSDRWQMLMHRYKALRIIYE